MTAASAPPVATAKTERLHFIDGAYTAGNSGKMYDVFNPVDGSTLCRVHEAGPEEVDAAVKAARAALSGEWGRLSVAARCDLLYQVADEINRRFDAFLDAEIADTGKPAAMARMIDIPRGAANFKVFADTIKTIPTESFHLDTPDGEGAVNYAVRVPKGVIGVIAPWNLPLLLMTWKVGPALTCGNTVVVKPSEQTPSTTTLLGEVMNAVGMPKGVFNVVHGFGPGSAGEYLTRHPGVDAITFTGETKTGEEIMKAAAKGVRDVSFELGGKNPSIIFADCDFEKAVEGTLRSVFSNCGQQCLSTERVYVERPIFDAFVSRMKAGAEAMKIGAPYEKGTELGPLISQAHREKVLSYYRRAVEDGATVVTGGGVPNMPDELANGYWIEPTIWTGLADDSAVMRDEIFGPCCHIRPFDTEEEVVVLANDTPYGLACAIWTADASRVHRVVRRVEAGIIWVNSWFLRDLRTPFGGSKQSGIGREGGVHSLEFYTELRNVCVKI
tara:strand:- start:183193 stop:184689 length:1497 start_codon:yes stop_codon:yes gene_type:complete